jgi:hypothetical protein
MNNEVFTNISKIIERDSKSTTYKFALLRGVIDIIQDNSPYIIFSGDRVHFPLGLLIEKWMLYYYPFLESSTNIPQINGGANLAFATQFHKIIDEYQNRGGFSVFYNDLKNKGIPKNLEADFILLSKKLRETITQMPMRYIGRSISDEYYSIFQYEIGKKSKANGVDIDFLIKNYGTFSVPRDYYDAFQLLGSFIGGQDSLLFKWAEFSVNASGKRLSVDNVLGKVMMTPITERQLTESKQIFRSILLKEGKVFCVWSGKAISKYDVDHLIPFSIWKNNDLWNLLPSDAKTNNLKRDKIPSAELIEKRKDQIFYYWNLLNEKQPVRFQKEIQVSLLGQNISKEWQASAINHLQDTCNYLISKRGYQEWRM